MASNYHLTVKKYLERNKIYSPLPEYIQRGWDRIYTPEEEEFLKRSCIISPDGHIPNSVVRHRLGTLQMLQDARLKQLRRALELPDELFKNLSREHRQAEIIEEENLFFQWDDDEEAAHQRERKRQRSSMDILLDKQREKRRKYEDYKYDYDTLEPLSIEEIVEEIRTNICKDLKSEEIQLLTELMQIISGNKNEQIMNVYDELSRVNLIDKFGAVPKLVQALQEIQKAFEQVAMKTNVASIETVLDLLREKDKTYRLAIELLNLFHEKTKKNRLDQVLNLTNKSSDISEYDHKVFDILIKDRINRLPATDLTMLLNDLKTIRPMDTSKLNDDHDGQMRVLLEQLNIIFTRAHLDGIKAMFNVMKSPISIALKEFIDIIENSLKTKLVEPDQIMIESYILDHLRLLNGNESKIVYERLAQQGTLKRGTGFNDLNQSITMGLMKKIDTDGLGVVVEKMKEAHLEINAMHELTQALTDINHHLHIQSSISLEQLQKQLDMAYFIETRSLTQGEIHQLAKAVQLYSIALISLPEEATNEQCSTFLEQLKAPLIGKCIQRILHAVYHENTVDLSKVSYKFYQQEIRHLLDELIHGSDQLNSDLLVQQVKERLKKTKELPDKLYRQMLKDKFIAIDTKTKIDTDKKKVAVITDAINRILNKDKDAKQQKQLMELFERVDGPLPERVKHWYTNKADGSKPSSPATKDRIREKNNVKGQSAIKTKSKAPMDKSERMKQATKERSSPVIVKSSSKRAVGVKELLPRSRSQAQTTVRPEKKPSRILDGTKKEKTNITARKSIGPSKISKIDQIPELSGIKEDNLIVAKPSPSASSNIIKEASAYIESTLPKQEQLLQDPVSQPADPISDTKTSAKRDSDGLSTYDDEHAETETGSTSSHGTDMFQADLQTIQPETTIDGKMGENQAFHFELEQTGARLLYHSSLPSDPKRDINIKISGQTAEFITDLPYEKTKAQRILAKPIPTDARHANLPENVTNSSPVTTDLEKPTSSSMNVSPVKASQRTVNKSLKQTDDYYINSLTKSLNNLFIQSKYDRPKLRKLHDELIASGHISPLNEFYRSTNEAVRVTLEHCDTYDQLIKWTLALLETTNKPNLIEFGRDLYGIAIDLDFALNERIDNTRCAMEIQEHLKRQLLTISDHDLREINSYLNAAQLEKIVHITKKLNVTSRDRMISDLNSLLLHLIQTCHTFDGNYRPLQTHIREIAESFKSNAVADLARKLDEIEKHLSKTFGVTLFGISQRMNESRFQLIK